MECLGINLCAEDRNYVLRAYVNRYTREHVPAWAKREWRDGRPYPVQFASDAEWLSHTKFAVRSDGRLDRRHKCCESTPTWPDGEPVKMKRLPADQDALTPLAEDGYCPECGQIGCQCYR